MQINKLKNVINNSNNTFLLLIVFCAFYLNSVVTGTEENYLALAKAYYNPGWLPNSFVFDHWLGPRYVFETFFGFLLNYFSIEAVVVFGRILAAGGMSYALSRLFKQINLTNLESLLVVLVFIGYKQNFFAREMFFLTVEPKVFAYILIFLSLTELKRGNLKNSTFFIIAATYLHVLVAGWFFIYFMAYLIWNSTRLRELIKILCLYVAGILPMALYLAPKVLSGQSEENGINLNWIYVYFRSSHHLAPFVDGKFAWDLYQVAIAGICFILAIIIHFKSKNSKEVKFFNDLNLVIASFLVLFFIVAYFDRNGDILKFYPFRGNALFLFFIIIEAIYFLRLTTYNPKLASAVSYLTIGLLITGFTIGTGRNLKIKYMDYILIQKKEKIAWDEATSFAKEQTAKEAVFLIKGVAENVQWTFTRKSDRDIFVSKKFVPVDKSKWYEWYQRVNLEIKDEQQLVNLKKNYKLDYYLTPQRNPRFGEVVFENSYYVISKI